MLEDAFGGEGDEESDAGEDIKEDEAAANDNSAKRADLPERFQRRHDEWDKTMMVARAMSPPQVLPSRAQTPWR